MESHHGDRIRLTVPATPAAARITRVGAASLAARVGFTYREVEQLRLAVDEAAALLVSGLSGPGGDAPPTPESDAASPPTGHGRRRGDPDGRMVVTYVIRHDGLRVEMRLEDSAAPRDLPVSDLAGFLLDYTVDRWALSDDRREVVLVKLRTDLDDDDP